MFTRLAIILSQDERKALEAAAEIEIRGASEQARFFVRQELERRGLLEQQPPAGERQAEEAGDE